MRRAAVAGALISLISAYLILLVLDPLVVKRLGYEDGPIESAGAIFFLLAASGLAVLAIQSAADLRKAQGTSVRRMLAFASLAILLAVCCGEEISWGQRIFGWRTPEFFSNHNAQNETNLHNIQAVHQWNADGSEKGFVGKLVNMNRLFSVFWMTFFVVLPLSAARSIRVRRWVTRIGIPVPPLWAGALFLVSYGIYKILASLYAGTARAHTLDEFKEMSYAAIYAMVAVSCLVNRTLGRSKTRD